MHVILIFPWPKGHINLKKIKRRLELYVIASQFGCLAQAYIDDYEII